MSVPPELLHLQSRRRTFTLLTGWRLPSTPPSVPVAGHSKGSPVVHQAGEGEVDTMGSPFLPWVHKHQDRPLVQVGPEFPVEKKKKKPSTITCGKWHLGSILAIWPKASQHEEQEGWVTWDDTAFLHCGAVQVQGWQLCHPSLQYVLAVWAQQPEAACCFALSSSSH